MTSGRRLTWLLTATLAIRIVFFLIGSPWQAAVRDEIVLRGDACDYHEYAIGLNAGGLATVGDLSIRRTPGYPFILAVAYKIFGVRPWVGIILNFIFAAGTLVLTYRIARDWFGEQAAFLAALFYAFDPIAIFSSCALLTDTLFALVFLGAVALLLRGMVSRKWTDFALSGALIGFGTLVRPVGQFLPLVFLVLLVVFLWRSWGSIVKNGLIWAVCFSLVLVPWLGRNYSTYGHFQLTDKGGQHLLDWVATFVEVGRTGQPMSDVRAQFLLIAEERGLNETENPFDRSKIQKDVAVEYLKSHPVAFMSSSIKGVVYTILNLSTQNIADILGIKSSPLEFQYFAPPGFFQSVESFFKSKNPAELLIGVVVGICFLTTYSLAIYGIFLALRSRQFFPVFTLVIFAAYFLMLVGPIGVGRYKLPFLPLYLAFSGLGAIRVISGWKPLGFIKDRLHLSGGEPE